MINKRFIITTVLSVFLIAGNSVFADSSDLLRMDVKKASSEDTVDVTFYTTGTPTNTVVTRKSGNTYVVLLPNVSGNQSVVPSLGGVKDLVSNVSVKNIDDGIGGYTKVTFNTTKPVKIQTATKKTAPLTKAQQDYKNLIAQNSKFDPDKKMENFKKTSTSTAQTKVAMVKPAVSAPKQPTATAKPATPATKPAVTKPVQASKHTAPAQKSAAVSAVVSTVKPANSSKANMAKTNTVQQTAKVQETKTVKNEITQPKTEGKIAQKTELKPETPKATAKTELKNLIAESKNAKSVNVKKQQKTKSEKKGLPIIPIAGALSVLGLFLLSTLMNIIVKAVKNNSKLKEYLENYNTEPQKENIENYQKIADNDNLSWQEKYKLYSEAKNSEVNSQQASYVTDMGGSKGVLADDDIAARVSQMEHALSQTPSMEKLETPNKGVHSEDDAIMNKMSGLHLKSFAKNINLKETSRHQLVKDESKVVTEPLKEGPLVKLKNSGLMMNRRNIGGHGFSISDLVRTGKRFLPKEDAAEEMQEVQEQYMVSSMEEYLDILDKEQSSVSNEKNVTEEITNMIPKRSRSQMMSVTNPMQKISSRKKAKSSDFNISIKSKYDIDYNKSIMMVESDGISSIIGKIGENVFVLKKFDKSINKPLQVRLDYGNVYIVRAGNFKCLVDVSDEKMGTLLEI